MLDNFGFGGAGAGAGRFSGGDLFTEAEIAEQNKKPPKEKAEKAKWDFIESLGQLTNSALAGASSVGELGDAMIGVSGQLGNQFFQNNVGGLGGQLLGGLFQFGINALMNDEQKLPVKDDAMDVRIVEVVDNALDFAAVRDKSQLAFQRERYNAMNSLQQRGA